MRKTSFLTSLDVARLIDTSRSTVQRWIDSGELKAFKTVGKHRRVKPEDLTQFLRKQGMPVPASLDTKVHILVVDDAPLYGFALKTLLERAEKRFEVDIAKDGLDGLLQVGVKKPDIVLLDAMMPGWDGFEVCRRLKGAPETRDIIVVGISGSEKNDAPFREAGADAFLLKPLDARVVVAVLALLGLGEGVSPD